MASVLVTARPKPMYLSSIILCASAPVAVTRELPGHRPAYVSCLMEREDDERKNESEMSCGAIGRGGRGGSEALWRCVSVRSTFLVCRLFFGGNPPSAQGRVGDAVVDMGRWNYAQAETKFPGNRVARWMGFKEERSTVRGRTTFVERLELIGRALRVWAACGFNSGGSRLF
jgi:hypothetical protein